MGRGHDIETEDNCGLRLGMRSGARIDVLASLCAEAPDTSISVVDCADARIEFSDSETIHIRRPGAPVEVRAPHLFGREPMIVDLHTAWRHGRPFPVAIEHTRAFTRGLNLASESAAPVVPVPPEDCALVEPTAPGAEDARD